VVVTRKRVNPGVAKALKSREVGLVSELESLTKKDVIIKSDPSVHQERFEICLAGFLPPCFGAIRAGHMAERSSTLPAKFSKLRDACFVLLPSNCG
jgi:hypothetical protein